MGEGFKKQAKNMVLSEELGVGSESNISLNPSSTIFYLCRLCTSVFFKSQVLMYKSSVS